MRAERLIDHFQRFIYLYAVLGSIIMALIIWSWRQPFSSDGLIYLYTAEVYQQQGFHAAMQTYSWPFMSMIIAWLAALTHLSILQASYLYNLIADTIMLVAAIALASACGLSRRQQLFLLLLLLVFPWLNHIRAHILRGHGYYAASFIAMLLLIYHAKQPRLYWAIGFSVMTGVAALFRIEGLMMLAAPLILLINRQDSFSRRCRVTLVCYIVPALCAILLFLLVWHHGRLSLHISQIQSDILLPLHQPFHIFLNKSRIIAQHILPFHARDKSVWLLAGGVIALILYQIVTTLGVMYTILLICSLWQRPQMADNSARLVIMAYLVITLLAAIIFFMHYFFLTDRYVALFALILILFIPIGSTSLYTNHCRRRRWRQSIYWMLLIFTLLYNTVASVWHFGPSKHYVIEAGNWIHDKLPPQAKIYVADPQLEYYTGHTKRAFIARQNGISLHSVESLPWQQYDYIAMDFSRKQMNLLADWSNRLGTPMVTFGSRHNGKVAIFATHTVSSNGQGDNKK